MKATIAGAVEVTQSQAKDTITDVVGVTQSQCGAPITDAVGVKRVKATISGVLGVK
jgi:hypothetical protein